MFLERVIKVGQVFEKDLLTQFEVSLQGALCYGLPQFSQALSSKPKHLTVEATNSRLFVRFTKLSFIKDVHTFANNV